MTIRRFEDLAVWREARDLANLVFRLTESDGFASMRSFREDVRGNAIRAMNNVAEGFERGSDREFAQYLKVARSTLGELRSQFYIALDRNFVHRTGFETVSKACLRLSRRVSRLVFYLENHALPHRTRGSRPPES